MIDWAAVEIDDDHVAALRLFLRDGPQTWEQLQKQRMTTDQGAAAYMQMFHAAFAVAVQRRFAPTHTIHDIVRYTANLRIELKGHGDDDFNPRLAENAIRGALGDPTLRSHDSVEVIENVKDLEHLVVAEMVVLFDVLLVEEESNEGAPEEYLQEAVDLARRWVRERQAAQAREKASAGRGGLSAGHEDAGTATRRDAGRELSRGVGGSWEAP